MQSAPLLFLLARATGSGNGGALGKQSADTRAKLARGSRRASSQRLACQPNRQSATCLSSNWPSRRLNRTRRWGWSERQNFDQQESCNPFATCQLPGPLMSMQRDPSPDHQSWMGKVAININFSPSTQRRPATRLVIAPAIDQAQASNEQLPGAAARGN